MVPMFLAFFFAGSPAYPWGITKIGEGEHTWEAAPWTAGLPGREDTVYINGEAKVILSGEETKEAFGIRIGSGLKAIPALDLLESVLKTNYIVVGDAVDANGSFVQAGGILLVEDDGVLGFEIGNPASRPAEPCYAIATFAAGQADLGDFRVNLRQHRKSRVALFGVLPRVSADSFVFATGTEEEWQPADLQYVLSDAGVAPLRVQGPVDFGAGDRVRILVDGSKYERGSAVFVLLEAEEIRGDPVDIRHEGFQQEVEIFVEENRLLLRVK